MGLLDKIEPNAHHDDSADRLADAQRAAQEIQLAKSRARSLLLELHEAFLRSGVPPEPLGSPGFLRSARQGWKLSRVKGSNDGGVSLAVGVDGEFYTYGNRDREGRCRRIDVDAAVTMFDSYNSTIRLVNGRPVICGYSGGRPCEDLEEALVAAVNNYGRPTPRWLPS